jgi:hypothetical protein
MAEHARVVEQFDSDGEGVLGACCCHKRVEGIAVLASSRLTIIRVAAFLRFPACEGECTAALGDTVL